MRLSKNFIKITVLVASFASIEFLIGWADIATYLRENFETLQSNPLLFLIIMGFGCAFSLPVWLCYFTAGICFGIVQGCLLCIAGITLSAAIGGIIGRFIIPDSLYEKFAKKARIIGLGTRGQFNVNFLVRAIPGVPYWLQNLLLGRITKLFSLYMSTAIVVQSVIAFTVIFLSASLEDNSVYLKFIALLCMILALSTMQMTVNLVMRHKKSAAKNDRADKILKLN